MKKIINFVLVLCLFVSSFFVLTACNNDLSAIVGTYSNTFYEAGLGKCETKLAVEKNGKFTYSFASTNGTSTKEFLLSGTLKLDKDGNIVDFTMENAAEAILAMKEVFMGNELPAELIEMNENSYTEICSLNAMLGGVLKEYISFCDGYVVMALPVGSSLLANQVLYKDGTEKLAEGEFIKFYTEKEAMKINYSMDAVIGNRIPTFETDYYFVKNAFDISTQKAEFISKLNTISGSYYANEIGYGKFVDNSIKDVENFDLSKVGVGTGTIKLMNNKGEELISQQVTYTVVETKEELPENLAKTLEVLDENSDDFTIKFIQKNENLYDLNWKIEHNTFKDPDAVKNVLLNETNCTGDTKIVNITGYDKTKTGYQVVTIEYQGAEIQKAVFVYDETINPVISASVKSGSKVVITKTVGTTTSYALDCTNVKITLKKADSTSTEVALQQSQIIELKELSNYRTDDEMIFGYDYKFNGKTYTFYCAFDVEVVDA